METREGMAVWWLSFVVCSYLVIFTSADFGLSHVTGGWKQEQGESGNDSVEYAVNVRDTGSGASVTIFATSLSDGKPFLGAALIAKLSPTDKYYPATPSDSVPGAYVISIYVSELGSYSFRVFCCPSRDTCQPVDDKVYKFNVAGKVSARKSFASGFSYLYRVGQEVKFNITAEDEHGVVETLFIDPIPFVVSITSTVAGSIFYTPAEIVEMGQGSYLVAFTPARVQSYHVSVTLEGSHISGGHWNFSTFLDESEDANKFYLQPDHEVIESVVVVGQHMMSIRCSETSYVAINNFTVEVSSADKNSAVAFSSFCQDSRSTVECVFWINITHPGKYSVLVALGDTPIKNMPYHLTIIPGMAMPFKSSISPAVSKVNAGTSVSYTVVLVDAFGNPAGSTFQSGLDTSQLIVGLFSSDATPVFGDINPAVDSKGTPVLGNFTAAFQVRVAHEYTVKAFFGPSSFLGQLTSNALGGSGFALTVEPSTPFAAKSILVIGSSMSAGSATLAKLHIKDAYSNNIGPYVLSGDLLSLQVLAPSLNFSYPATGVGEHFEFLVQGIALAQLYQVTVCLDGEPFLTGYELSLIAGPLSPVACKFSQLRDAVAGESSWFRLQLLDMYGNNVSLASDDSPVVDELLTVQPANEGTSVYLTLISGGFYNVSFYAVKSGKYTITFGWTYEKLRREIAVNPGRLNASQVVLSGPGVIGGIVGSNMTVFIAPRDSFGNEIPATEFDRALIEIEGSVRPFPGAEDEAVPLAPKIYPVRLDSSSNLYLYEYSTLRAGFMEMTITANNESSRFSSVHSSGALDVGRSYISGLGLTGTVVNMPATFYITARDSHGNAKNDPGTYGASFRVKLCNSVLSCNVGSIAVDDLHYWEGRYAVTYVTAQPGNFSVSVSWFDKELGGSPAVVQVMDSTISRSTDTVNFTICGGFPFMHSCPGLFGAVANQEAFITLLATDENGVPLYVGGAKLLLTIDPSSYAANVQDLQNGTYVLSYIINVAGNYTMMLQMDETLIIQQPILILPGPTSAKNSKMATELPSAFPAGTVFYSLLTPFDDWQNEQVYGDAYPLSNDVYALVARASTGEVAYGSISINETGSLIASLTIIRAGVYNVSCLLNGVPLSGAEGMPLEVFSGPPSALFSKVFLSNETIAGSLGIVTVNLRDDYGNELNQELNCTASVTYYGSRENLSALCSLLSYSTFQIVYNITEAGLYNLSFVIVDNSDVSYKSWCNISVIPDKPSAEGSRVEGQGLTSSIAGSESVLLITCFDIWNNTCSGNVSNYFVVVLEMETLPPVFAKIKSNINAQDGQAQLLAKYTVPRPGNYSCSVFIGDENLRESPFPVTVYPAQTSAANSFSILDSFAGRLNTSLSEITLTAGSVGKLRVVVCDAYGNRQDMSVVDTLVVKFYPDPDQFSDPTRTFADYDKYSRRDGTYDVTFSATRANYYNSTLGTYVHLTYFLSIGLVGGNGISYDISGSPYKYRLIPGGVNVANSDVIQKESWCDENGLNWRVDLIPKDSFGNMGMFSPSLNVSALLQLSNWLGEDGRAADVGNLKVKPHSNSAPKLNSVKSPPKSSNSPGLAEYYDLELLNVREANNAPFVIDNGNGSYSVLFSVVVAGLYNVSLFINGNLVGGPWVTIPNYRVDPGPVDLSKMIPSGEGLGANFTIAGQLSAIMLQFSDKFGNMLSVSSEEAADYIPNFLVNYRIRDVGPNSFIDHQGTDAIAYKNISTDEDGLMWLYYQPLKSGQLLLDIFVVNSSEPMQLLVEGSPFFGSVLPGSVFPGKCVARGPGINSALVCTNLACPSSTILLEARDGMDNVVRSDVYPSICADFSVSADPSFMFSIPTPFNGQCLVTYTASTVSVQNVAIEYLGSPIYMSPFQVVVQPTVRNADPSRSIAFGDLDEIIVAGKMAVITVQLVDVNGVALFFSPDMGDNYVSLSILNSTAAPSSPTILSHDNGDGTFHLELLVHNTGVYYFNIFVGVMQSPLGGNFEGYQLQVVSGPTSLETTGVTLVSNATVYRSGIDEIKIEVVPMDILGNLQDYITGNNTESFTSQISQPDGSTVYVPLILNSSSSKLGVPYQTWVLNFMPTQSAFEGSFYTFNFVWRYGFLEDLVPLQISVLSYPGLPYGENTQVLGQGASIAVAGVLTSFYVQLYDKFKNPIVSFSDIVGTEISVSLRMGSRLIEQNCTAVSSPVAASCTYVAPASGTYTLDVTAGEWGTKRFPNVLVGAGPVFTPFCRASGDGIGEGAPIYAGKPTRFVIEMYDILTNLVFDAEISFSVFLENMDDANDPYLQPESIYQQWTGTNYEVYYTPVRAGWSQLYVTRSFTNITGSPFSIKVLAGPVSAVTSSVDPASLQSCVSGQMHNITLQSRDAFGNIRMFDSDVFQITKLVHDAPEEWEIAPMVYLGGGQYGFSYQCVRAGSSSDNPNSTQIIIEFGEIEVLNVQLPVSPGPVNISKCTATLADSALSINQVASIQVVSKDWAENRLWEGGLNFRVILVQDHSNVTATANDTLDGAYFFTFTHTVSGNHTVLAFLDDQVFFQDYVIVYPAAPNPASTQVTFDPNGYTASMMGSLKIQLFDMFFNNVTNDALVQSQMLLMLLSEDIPARVSYPRALINRTGDVYDVYFVPECPGSVKLHFLISGNIVGDENGLPFSAAVFAGLPASNRFILFGAGIESGGIANQAAIFFVRIMDSVGNVLSAAPGTWAAAFSPASVVQTLPVVIQLGNGTPQISYIPTQAISNLAVSLMYNGQIVGKTRYVKVKPKIGSWSVMNSVALDPQGVPIIRGEAIVGVVGVDLIITIQARDLDGMDFTGISDPSIFSFAAKIDGVAVPIIPTSKGPFGIIVNFSVARKYVVDISSVDGNQMIKNSGFVLFLVPGQAHPPSTLYFRGSSVTNELSLYASLDESRMFDDNDVLRVGEETSIILVARDEYGNRRALNAVHGDDVFTATLTYVSTASIYNSFITIDNYGAAHVLHITPLFGGSYKLDVFLNGVQAQTFAIKVASIFTDYSNFVMKSLEDNLLEAGKLNFLELHFKDMYSVSNVGEHLFAELQPNFDVLPVEVGIQPLPNITAVLLSVVATVAGPYDVVVTDASTKITGIGPASVIVSSLEISSGPISNLTTMFTVSPIVNRANEQITVFVEGKDMYGNLNCTLPALVLTSPSYPVRVDSLCTKDSSTTHLKSSSFSLVFIPSAPGTVSISLMWDDVEIELNIDVLRALPPTVTSAILSNNLNTITVFFDQDTDCGYYGRGLNETGSSRCAAFLDSSIIPKLGSSPSCTFHDSRSLLISLGNEATILPSDSSFGDFIIIRNDSIFSANGTSYPVKGKVALQQPDNPVLPIAKLEGPTAVGPCDSLYLDASASSGSGGRPLKYSYFVEGSGNQNIVTSLRAILGNVSSDQFWVWLEPGILEHGQTYQFTATVVNFRGASASSSVRVKATSLPVPLLSIFGADQIRFGTRSELIQIEAIATLPSSNPVDSTGRCLVNSSFTPLIPFPTLVYRWSQSAGPILNLSSIVVNERVLSIPGNRFESDCSYGFSVTCYFLGFPASLSTAEITLSIDMSPILVDIIGGSRTANSSESFMLEAAVFDPDDSADAYGFPYQAKYTWKCDGNWSLDNSFLKESTPSNDFGRQITVPAQLLGNGSYNFSVSVDKEPFTEGRVGVTAWVIIEASLTQVLPVSLMLDYAPGFIQGMSPAKQVKLRCDAEVHNYSWSIESESDRRTFTDIETAARGQDTMFIPPHTLLGGAFAFYTVMCSVQSGNAYGAAKVRLITQSDPSGGTVLLTRRPADGPDIAGQTLYTLVAYGWTPGEGIEHGALQYEFRYLVDNVTQSVVQPLSTVNSVHDIIVQAGSVVFQVYVANPGPVNVTSDDAPHSTLYELPRINVLNPLPESSAATQQLAQRNVLFMNSSHELLLYNDIFTPMASQGQYYSALHVVEVFGSQYIKSNSKNCSFNPTLAQIVNDMLGMIASTDPQYPPPYVSGTVSSGSGPYTALAVACAYSKILGIPGNIGGEELSRSLDIMVDKLQQVALHRLNVPSISGQPYNPCFFDAVDVLLNAIHAECSQMSSSLMGLASRMPLWLAQIVSNNIDSGSLSPSFVYRPSFSILSSRLDAFEKDESPKILTESIESFQFEVITGPHFQGTVSAAVACYPSFAPLSMEERKSANFYKDLLAIVEVCDFTLLGPEATLDEVVSLVVSFVDVIAPVNDTFAILHFKDEALNFSSFGNSLYENGTVSLQLVNSTISYNTSSRLVLAQVVSNIASVTRIRRHVHTLLAGVIFLWLQRW